MTRANKTPGPRRAKRREAPRTARALSTYNAKRNFDTTPEPSGTVRARAKSRSKGGGEFVVQRHDARRLHYDVRIEIDGVMMSWAVPKGPSYDPAVKRLAVETEDHPIAYNRFEGRIPDGEYGAGDVLVWDRGTFETVPPGEAHEMRAKGHLRVRFHGEKLEGEWHFVRTRRGSGTKNAWLMFKADDETADASFDVVSERPESIVSGRRASRGPRRRGASEQGRSAGALLDAVGEIEKATLVEELPDASDWLFELKYDGYRALAARAGDDVKLASRNAKDWTERFSRIADAVRALPARELVLDGEVCALDDAGRPSFPRLQQWIAGEAPDATITYVAFDLLWLDGRDLRALPLEERQTLLGDLLRDARPPLARSSALDGTADTLLNVACNGGLEGVIAKRRGSPYRAGRTKDWVKLKCARRQEFAVVGYLPQRTHANELGALLLAVRSPSGSLAYAGRVGTGFDSKTRRALARRLDARRTETPPCPDAPRVRGARWSEPALVVEVSFTEWTTDGRLRHPVFVAVREDKKPNECVREAPAPLPKRVVGARHASPRGVGARHASPLLSNPSKLLYPRDAVTKRDVADYFARISPVILPHLRGRPLALERWPDGIGSPSWFQQRAPENTPEGVHTLVVDRARRVVADNPETLAWLANLAALTLHGWSARTTSSANANTQLLHPDRVVFDLDPGEDTRWPDVIAMALALRSLLDGLGLPSFPKTSGKRGLHVVVPIAREHTHEEATTFARRIVDALARAHSTIATSERMKAKRGGRMYLDALQNGWGKTLVVPYSLRGVDGAPVSTPLRWSEVTTRLDPTRFTLRTVPRRVEKFGDLLAGALEPGPRLPSVR